MIVVRTVADLREALDEYPDYMQVYVESMSDMGLGPAQERADLVLKYDHHSTDSYPYLSIQPDRR